MKPRLTQRIQFSLAYALVVVVLLSLLQSWLLAPRTVELPMSKFLDLLRADKIEKVALTEKEIRGLAKPGALPAPAAVPGDWLRQRLGSDDEVRVFTVTRIPGVDEQRLVAELEQHHVEFSGRIETTFWKDLLFGWVIPVGIWMFLMRRVGGGPTQALSFGRSKHKIYDRKELKTTFADVAGVDEAKAELIEIVDFLKNPKKYQRLGGRIPKGVLLVGPPGTGKTLLARAVAGEADVPFFFLSGSEFVEMFVGVGASRVRDLFEQAKEKAPCIVFIDELDAIGKTRAGATGFVGGHDEREQTLNQLLAEMDGFDSSKGVIIMAATNRPEALDPVIGGLERKSRVLSEKERDIVAHHEIGHALVASSLPQADPVHKVTIIPRGVGALGATYQLPLEDRYLLTRSELEDRIAVLLGGRAAEEIVYGEISTGAHNDLDRATEMARLMVMQYGMSDHLGPMTFGGGRQALFLKGAGVTAEREYSEDTARAIDGETRAIIDRIYDRVRGLITDRKLVLLAAAAELKAKETLEGDRLRHLLAGEPVEEKR